MGTNNGTTGDCSWTLTDTTLTISGTGEMANYHEIEDAPWHYKWRGIPDNSPLIAIRTVVVNNGVTRIGDSAFRCCYGLTSANIPNSVKRIGFGAFEDRSSLTSITIPNSVTSIDMFAFCDCSGLSSVTCLATTPPTLGDYSFTNVNATLYVPASSLNDYKNNSSWNRAFRTILAI